MNENLTQSQEDYAIYLPAVSNFYVSCMGKEISGEGVPANRVPQHFEKGTLGLNWLTDQNSYFNYRWNLYSAGHADLEATSATAKEQIITNRDRSTSWLLGDSGGFQVGKLVWQADWKDPNCPRAAKKRQQVLNWMDTHMDYGMTLDIPIWIDRIPGSAEKSGISSPQEALMATKINNDYFINNRTGACKFLNVLQGEDHTQAQEWYEGVKDYCNPKKYPNNHFNGWAMGGKNQGDPHLILRRMAELKWSGLLEEGVHDWMHFLGISKLEWSLMFTDIQRAVRQTHNANFTISFDCASPFLATRNGQIYHDIVLPDVGRWSYRMYKCADDKKYSNDTRKFSDAVVQDGFYKVFQDSPVSDLYKMKDICIYKPGDLNKIGKEGKSSWDGFSYILLKAHNVWMHITSVQEANRRYDAGEYPKMMRYSAPTQDKFEDVVERIFAAPTKQESMDLIEQYANYWLEIAGTRGYTGKKARNATTMFNSLFDSEEEDISEEPEFDFEDVNDNPEEL